MKKIPARLSLITGTLLALSFSSGVQAEKYYKWVDAKGVTHYSAQPPKSGNAKLLKIRGGKSRSQFNPATRQVNDKASKPGFDAAKEADRLNKEAFQENCGHYRKNLKIMTENSRVKLLDDKGKARMLSEEERQAEIKQAKDYIKDHCQGSLP